MVVLETDFLPDIIPPFLYMQCSNFQKLIAPLCLSYINGEPQSLPHTYFICALFFIYIYLEYFYTTMFIIHTSLFQVHNILCTFHESQQNAPPIITYTEYTEAGFIIPMVDKRIRFTSPSLKLGNVSWPLKSGQHSLTPKTHNY